MGKLKLKWRIFVFLLGFCALLLVILWFFLTVLLTDMYKLIRKKEIDRAITLVEQNINKNTIQTILNELEFEQEIFVMPTHEFAPPYISEQYIYKPGIYGRPKPEAITQTKEFILQDGRAVSFTFYAMITPVGATVSTLLIQLYIITAIMLILAVFLAVIISRRISKPIEDINKSAKVLASGSYDTHFNGKGFLEIKELSDTLNTAAVELAKAENLRRELMANISHDLRTPLSLIYSYAEMMHDFPDEVTPQQTETIMDEAKRLSSLVNDILDVSQLETKTIELRKTTYCLTKSICSTINRVSELVKNEGYAVNFEYDKNVYIYADEVKITQAFYNLLINAVHYCGNDKTIIIRQKVSGSHVKIEVSDNGEGISPENLAYVWDRYYKVDKKHKRAIAGTGLGLSIVKKIIGLHDGSYGVESEPDKGSTFWFKINI